jgi:hypothetical protein
VDAHKLPKMLAGEIVRHQVDADIDIGCYQYYQPSLVFYTQRQIHKLDAHQKALDLLHSPRQTFLLTPAEHWQRLRMKVVGPVAVVARRRDFLTGNEVLLVTNRVAVGGQGGVSDPPPFRLEASN